jgi:hypothetical protein
MKDNNPIKLARSLRGKATSIMVFKATKQKLEDLKLPQESLDDALFRILSEIEKQYV